MKKHDAVAGIDCGKRSFVIAIQTKQADQPITKRFQNNEDGFLKVLSLIEEQGVDPSQTLICVEEVGTYADKLCHFLHQATGSVFMAHAQHVHRTIWNPHRKTDSIDSVHICRYAQTFPEELRRYKPESPVVSDIDGLLKARAILVTNRTRCKNLKGSLQPKHVPATQATIELVEHIAHQTQAIKKIEKAIRKLVASDPQLAHGIEILQSAPGVGKILSWNMLVYTKGFQSIPDSKKAASHLGLAPEPYQSGSSVRKKARSRRHGPPEMRKLLHMSVRSKLGGDSKLNAYFVRKKAEGKHSSVALNNLCNKQLMLLLAMLRTWTPYSANHRAVRPQLLT